MVTFCISLIALVLGYLLYGRFVDKVAPEIQAKPRVQALKAQYAASREKK